MDSATTIKELKSLVQKFCEDRNWDQFHNMKELAIGISTEANELLQIFRFKSEVQLKDIENKTMFLDVKEELADTLYFILRFAQLYNIDLTTELRSKVEKNNLKYPIEKSKGSNKKYNE